MTRRVRAWLRVVAAITAVAVAAGCSSSGGSSTESVFDATPGQCFTAPTAVKAELSDLTKVACTKPHTQELYADVDYVAAGTASSGASAAASSVSGGAYPGADVLDTFAKGACAQQFKSYVGVDYLNSTLFYTYLLPSARSWEQNDDRTVLCFVTTTGGTLTTSVKGSRR